MDVGKYRTYGIIEKMISNRKNAELVALTEKFRVKFSVIEGKPHIDNRTTAKIRRMFVRPAYKFRYKYRDYVSFGIFSSKIIREIIERDGYFFDENFINGMEDHDILLRLSLLKIPYKIINYGIGLYYNSSLGVSVARYLRDTINFTYFSYKLDRL